MHEVEKHFAIIAKAEFTDDINLIGRTEKGFQSETMRLENWIQTEWHGHEHR